MCVCGFMAMLVMYGNCFEGSAEGSKFHSFWQGRGNNQQMYLFQTQLHPPWFSGMIATISS